MLLHSMCGGGDVFPPSVGRPSTSTERLMPLQQYPLWLVALQKKEHQLRLRTRPRAAGTFESAQHHEGEDLILTPVESQ